MGRAAGTALHGGCLHSGNGSLRRPCLPRVCLLQLSHTAKPAAHLSAGRPFAILELGGEHPKGGLRRTVERRQRARRGQSSRVLWRCRQQGSKSIWPSHRNVQRGSLACPMHAGPHQAPPPAVASRHSRPPQRTHRPWPGSGSCMRASTWMDEKEEPSESCAKGGWRNRISKQSLHDPVRRLGAAAGTAQPGGAAGGLPTAGCNTARPRGTFHCSCRRCCKQQPMPCQPRLPPPTRMPG